MEFPFYISSVLKTDENGFSVVTSDSAQQYMRENNVYTQKYSIYKTIGGEPQKFENNLKDIIDRMGANSSKAQKIPVPITSFARLVGSNHRLYFSSQGK